MAEKVVKLSRDRIHKIEVGGVTCFSLRIRYPGDRPEDQDDGPYGRYTCEHLTPERGEKKLDEAVDILINDPGAAFDNSQLRLCEACMGVYENSPKATGVKLGGWKTGAGTVIR